MKFLHIIGAQFKKEYLFYTLMFLICLIVVVINRILVGFTSVLWMVDLATVFGVTSVILISRHSLIGLYFNLISTIFLVITSYYQQIWLTGTIALFISIPSLLIGIIRWKYNVKKQKASDNIKYMTTKWLVILVLLTLGVSIAFMQILYLLNGTYFYLDAVISACCLIGIILTSYTYLEQFYFFAFSNIVAVVMFSLLSAKNINNLSYIVLYILDFIVNISGMINWKKLKNQKINSQIENQ